VDSPVRELGDEIGGIRWRIHKITGLVSCIFCDVPHEGQLVIRQVEEGRSEGRNIRRGNACEAGHEVTGRAGYFLTLRSNDWFR
jgi:hypothetical protein